MDGVDSLARETLDVKRLASASDEARRQARYDASLTLRLSLAEQTPDDLWAHLEVANDQQALGAFPEAEAAIRTAERISPDHPDVHLAFGRLARRRGDRRAALLAHLTGTERAPRAVALRLELGADHLVLGDPAAAEAQYREALALAPDNIHAFLGLARCARARGDRRASLAHHEAARDAHPSEVGPLLEVGVDCLALGDVAGATAAYEQAHAIDPANVHALFGLAGCARARGDRRASLAHHEAARAAQPGHAPASVEIGADLLALGEIDRAQAAYEQALAHDGRHVPALFGLARCARARGDRCVSLGYHETARRQQPDNVWAAIESGAYLLALGEVDRAQSTYEQARTLDGRNVQVLFGLARCARARGNARASLDLHERALAEQPDNVWAHAEIGTDLLSLGEPGRARQAFERALAIDSGNAQARQGLAACDAAPQAPPAAPEPPPAPVAREVPPSETASSLLVEGDVAAAERLYASVLSGDPLNVQAMFGLARCARTRGDRRASLAQHEAALRAEPENVWAAVEAGADLLALGEPDAAQPRYERALAIDPANMQAMFGLGRCARARGDHRGSLARFEAAWRAQPDNVWAAVEMGGDFEALGQFERAQACYERARALQPANVQALFGLGRCARVLADRRASLAFFEEALAAEGRNVWAHVEIGADLLALGEPERAQHAYDQALAIDGSNDQAMLGRARCASVAGDLAQAVELGRRTAELMPGNAWAQLDLSLNLRALGRLDEAEAACSRAAELAPDQVEPLLGLCACARLRGRRQAALAHARSAHRIAPARAEPLVEMGIELRALDQPDAAGQAFTAALQRGPGHVEALIGLASLARLRADRQAALGHLREAVARNPGVARAAIELGLELRALSLFGEAREVVQAALERHPHDLYVALELGAIERGAGDLEAARRILLQAAADHPHRAAPLIEAAVVERELGHTDRAAALLAQAAAIEPGNASVAFRRGEQAMACRDPATALEFFRTAFRLYPSEPGAALAAVEAMIELGETAQAQQTLDELEAAYPAAHRAIRRSRITLLRRTGDWERGVALAREATDDAPDDFHLAIERFQLERLVGRPADVDRTIALIPARARGEIAQTQRLAGDWAEEQADVRVAREAMVRAESLDPLNAEIQWDLCRLAMHALDIGRARHHLARFAELTAGHARARGGAPHPSQSHYGQILDELALDEATVARLRPLAGRPAEERVAIALEAIRDNPDSTAAALFATVALREIPGALGRRDRGGASPVPRRIAQFWNDPTPPADITRFMGEWQARSTGWTHTRFTDATARGFLHGMHGAAAAAAYDRISEPAQKADLFRLGLLAMGGGVYLDADDRPRAAADALLDGASGLILYQEDFGTIGNNMLAARPGHPVLVRAFEQALGAMRRGDRDVVWLSTGPGLITRCFAFWLAEAGDGWRARLGEATVLHRRELFACMAVHCHAGYKRTARHWSNSTFARAKRRGGASEIARAS